MNYGVLSELCHNCRSIYDRLDAAPMSEPVGACRTVGDVGLSDCQTVSVCE